MVQNRGIKVKVLNGKGSSGIAHKEGSDLIIILGKDMVEYYILNTNKKRGGIFE